MGRKFSEGDRVVVKGEHGEGKAVVTGIDPASGIPTVVFEKVVVENTNGGPPMVQENVQGYVPHHQMARRRS